jgi:hypothetical protein
VIRIERPILIGFFPSTWGTSLEEHFYYALVDTARCLEGHGVEFRAVGADTLVIKNGPQREEILTMDGAGKETFGCFLAWPGRPARIVRSPDVMPSALGLLCPAAARNYFSILECCPEGMICCPDGTFATQEDPCVMELP